jgi:hypothetical protein
MDKKIFAEKFKDIINVIASHSVINPITALNISYSFIKNDENRIKRNQFFPKVSKKQGINGIESNVCIRKNYKDPSIFVSFSNFTEGLKKNLDQKTYIDIVKARSNPQLQLELLRKIGI